MTQDSDSLEPTLDRLTTERTSEQKTMEDLARQKLSRDDDQLKRNLSELERLTGLDPDETT
jgi:hypothetical protein